MIIAIDIGTSSIKTALIDLGGGIVKEYQLPIRLYTEEGGVAEHDIEEISRNVVECIKVVARGFERKIEAVSFGCYLHGLALLDHELKPFTKVLTHLDTRSSTYQDKIAYHGFDLYMRTGCPPLFVYPLTKLLWAKGKGLLKRTRAVSFVKDYVVYKLIDLRVIDYGTASGTGLMNIHNLRWDSLAMELADLDEGMLPELVEGAKVLEYRSFPDLGLDKVAIVLGSFDGALQNIGYSVYEDEGVLNLGSTAVVRILKKDVTLDRSEEMRFFCYYAADGYRVIGAASNNGMTFLEWVKDNILRKSEWDEVLQMVRETKPCSDDVYVLPFITGERFPFRNPYLRLTVLGVGIHHKVNHLIRASVEGVGYTLKTALNAIEENNVNVRSLHCGGGGCNLYEVVKVISNILAKPITLYNNEIMRAASILGGALVAIRALNYVNDISKTKLESLSTAAQHLVVPDTQTLTTYEKCYKKFLTYVKELAKIYEKL